MGAGFGPAAARWKTERAMKMFVRSEVCMTPLSIFPDSQGMGRVGKDKGKSKILLERYSGDRHALRNE
jgi:hypothetical protein